MRTVWTLCIAVVLLLFVAGASAFPPPQSCGEGTNEKSCGAICRCVSCYNTDGKYACISGGSDGPTDKRLLNSTCSGKFVYTSNDDCKAFYTEVAVVTYIMAALFSCMCFSNDSGVPADITCEQVAQWSPRARLESERSLCGVPLDVSMSMLWLEDRLLHAAAGKNIDEQQVDDAVRTLVANARQKALEQPLLAWLHAEQVLRAQLFMWKRQCHANDAVLRSKTK